MTPEERAEFVERATNDPELIARVREAHADLVGQVLATGEGLIALADGAVLHTVMTATGPPRTSVVFPDGAVLSIGHGDET